MATITTLDQIRKYVRVRFMNANASLPDITATENRFIIPIVGQTLLDEAITAAINTQKAKLLELIRAAVGPLAYWQDLPNIHVQIGDNGVTVQKSDNQEAVHRWEFEQLRESLAEKGCAALEVMISYLYANAIDLGWAAPGQYKTIFVTGIEFNKYFTIYQPNRTFEMLRPFIRQVEDQYIHPTIGEDFYTALKTAAAPTTEEKKALELLKKSVANYTIKLSVEVLPIRISADGFTVALNDQSEKPAQGQAQAPESQFTRLYDSTALSGDTYLIQLKEYLDNTANDAIFSTYKASAYYTSPTVKAAEVAPNSKRNGVFGM